MKALHGIFLLLALMAPASLPLAWAQGPTAPRVINVNTATQAELEALPGIGPKIAREIIRNRPYRDAKELQARVKGIGPKTWEEIKRYVRFR
ncbi:MAG: helix-hairpin-helix domain-containing protein [Meiothermus sp.]|uniref:ComEA family DNA-binding protein n=1 Tax=Meiothermus sp. TaxID=1955249 RepID=UPI0025D92A88|nr:helix-hairpin-helix domain-containing protein [Meiothermus sp.]MCS7069799.1 helix-hairpin-helix domain-containing protein [Meiothermus sp.]MDW8426268.1 helix-hairpin-helix domain-containing protein [Meiothermus sp.]